MTCMEELVQRQAAQEEAPAASHPLQVFLIERRPRRQQHRNQDYCQLPMKANDHKGKHASWSSAVPSAAARHLELELQAGRQHHRRQLCLHQTEAVVSPVENLAAVSSQIRIAHRGLVTAGCSNVQQSGAGLLSQLKVWIGAVQQGSACALHRTSGDGTCENRGEGRTGCFSGRKEEALCAGLLQG